jgi:hypothetical protein
MGINMRVVAHAWKQLAVKVVITESEGLEWAWSRHGTGGGVSRATVKIFQTQGRLFEDENLQLCLLLRLIASSFFFFFFLSSSSPFILVHFTPSFSAFHFFFL